MVKLWDDIRCDTKREALRSAQKDLIVIRDTAALLDDSQGWLERANNSLEKVEAALEMTDSELADVNKICKFLELM